MQQVAIRCHPRAPLVTEELEQWLSQEVEGLRTGAPEAEFRLLRVIQPLPDGEMEAGWLIEVDAAAGEQSFDDDDGFVAVLRDMRLLGLQPTVLTASPRGEAPREANAEGSARDC